MIYALNLYDLHPDKEHIYKEYVMRSSEASAHITTPTVLLAGTNPLKELRGQTRDHFLIAGFEDLAHFEQAMAVLDQEDLHRLREAATENYIWTLYEPWELGSWLASTDGE